MRDFNRVFREMERSIEQANERARRRREKIEAVRDAEGYRVEVVDGERKEYIYEDDDWVPLGEEDDEDSLDYELTQSDGSFEMTVDMASQLPDLSGMGVVSQMNNGVLSLSFIDEEEEETEE